MTVQHLVAVDLGASSGRLMTGAFDGNTIALTTQYRFSNQPVNQNGHLFWDVLKLYQDIKYGLNQTTRNLGALTSLAVDTWGVDYGFLSAQGDLLMNPHSYRDARGLPYTSDYRRLAPPQALFTQTGVVAADINSRAQLYADLHRNPWLQSAVERVLFMPGLLSWFFSGQAVTEFTIASTSGLLNAQTRDWDAELLATLGLPQAWFTPVTVGGADLGPVLPAIAQELQLNPDLRIIAGAGHDTAAALLGLPLAPTERAGAAFISAGTWSIIGRFTAAPVLTEAACTSGLTNEGTFDGGNRLLKNVTGLWLLQQLQAEWSYQGEVVDFNKMEQLAAAVTDNHSYIDPNDPSFIGAGDMAGRIAAYLDATGQEPPRSRGHLLRIVYESLALAYHQTITQLETATTRPVQVIHMFGGGIQDRLLLQLTADFTQRPIVPGPVEASAMGNLVSQLMVQHQLDAESAVAVLERSYRTQTVLPTPAESTNAYAAFNQLTTP